MRERSAVPLNQSRSSSSSKTRKGKDSLHVAKQIAKLCRDHRATDVVILDHGELMTEFDCFVIATGSSRRQLRALSDEVGDFMRGVLGSRPIGIEGHQDNGWILLDYGDVIVHLFEQEARAFYDLENLWSNARRVPFPVEAAPAVDPSRGAPTLHGNEAINY